MNKRRIRLRSSPGTPRLGRIHAKVRVADSNPVSRSNKSPGVAAAAWATRGVVNFWSNPDRIYRHNTH